MYVCVRMYIHAHHTHMHECMYIYTCIEKDEVISLYSPESCVWDNKRSELSLERPGPRLVCNGMPSSSLPQCCVMGNRKLLLRISNPASPLPVLL